MHGQNPIRKPDAGDGSVLQVQGVFATLQGEGPFAGHPAVFVRLGGCNLACDFCDTEFESFAPVTLGALTAEVCRQACEAEKRVRGLVVITGGEPLRQNIAPFCESLLEHGFAVQLETNGTLWRELPAGISVVCSPKHTGLGYTRLRGDVLAHASALKFIISRHRAGYDDVAEIGQSDYNIPVYVQPMDEQDERLNAENTQLALEMAMRRGYRLSLQTHKMLGIE